MTEYGIFAWFGYALPIETRLRLIREAGFERVMLWWGDEFSPWEGPKQGHAALARRLGLRIENAHAPYDRADDLWNVGLAGDSYESMLSACLESCADCSIMTLVVHPENGPFSRFSSVKTGIERLRRLTELAARRGVTLALENLKHPACLETIFSALQSEYLGFCFDCGHDFANSGTLDLLKKYGPLLRAVHIHDNDGTDDQHLVPGEGRIDWAEFRAGLEIAGYNGARMLECALPWHQEDESDERREAPEAYLQRALEAAKRLL